MNADWPLRKLSDVADFLNHKRVPLKSLDRDKRQGEYPYYGASGVVDHIDDYIFDGTYLLISEDGENLRTRKTPIAFKATGKFWVNNHAHILAEKEEGILDYLEYYFSNLDLTPYITGAVQPKLNKTNLDTVEIPVPPKEERLYINRVLNSFTNKIELNRQTNQTLEHIAQTIFKSWFVDFEPTYAKIAAKQAGQDPERAAIAAISGKSLEEINQLTPEQQEQLKATAALFPDRLMESELGEVPEGWRIQILEDILELAYGKALKKSDRVDGEFPVYGSGGFTGTHHKPLVDGPGIIVGRKGTVGALYWEDESFFPIDTVFYVKCKHETRLVYVYYLLQTLGLDNMNTDAAVPGLNRNNVYRLEVVKPPKDLVCIFSSLIEGFRAQIATNKKETMSLVSIRDSLLPKLLSGELDRNKVA
ncbi:restriction endonuclease subunit S [Neptuniibacter sp. QD48_55]|uniref:restriction endonuclease subunit S n=1 Tax=Neptuniibacter sp. QD48_55 TaxID=3398212 RepID=UPI0039F63BC9